MDTIQACITTTIRSHMLGHQTLPIFDIVDVTCRKKCHHGEVS